SIPSKTPRGQSLRQLQQPAGPSSRRSPKASLWAAKFDEPLLVHPSTHHQFANDQQCLQSKGQGSAERLLLKPSVRCQLVFLERQRRSPEFRIFLHALQAGPSPQVYKRRPSKAQLSCRVFLNEAQVLLKKWFCLSPASHKP